MCVSHPLLPQQCATVMVVNSVRGLPAKDLWSIPTHAEGVSNEYYIVKLPEIKKDANTNCIIIIIIMYSNGKPRIAII